MKKLAISMIVAGALFLTGANARADQVIADDVIIEGKTCIGSSSCVNDEVFGSENVKLKDSTVAIFADDIDIGATGFR